MQDKITQIVGIPMGLNCAPYVADLFLFCNERYFMTSLSDDNQSNIIVQAFHSTSSYPNGILNIDNLYFEGVVNQLNCNGIKLQTPNSSF